MTNKSPLMVFVLFFQFFGFSAIAFENSNGIQESPTIKTRKQAYERQLKYLNRFDQERQAGAADHFAYEQQWEKYREANRKLYKNEKELERRQEQLRQSQQEIHRKSIAEWDAESERARKEYIQFLKRPKDTSLSIETELGLEHPRPRFPYKMRAEYGGKPSFKRASPGSASDGLNDFSPYISPNQPSGFSGGDYNPGNEDYIPPPPPPPPPDFNDFPGGYPDPGNDFGNDDY